MIKVRGFNVRLVNVGATYGEHDRFINTTAPMIEFYDNEMTRQGRGQFIARMRAEMMFLPDLGNGFALDQRVEEWALNREDVKRIREWLKTAGGIDACFL